MDKSHPLLSHQYSIASRLSDKFESTLVITDKSRGSESSKNLTIIDLELSNLPKFLKLFTLIKTSVKVVFRYKPQVVFYHMVDLHAAILSPFFKILGVRQVLWYAHAHKSWKLNCAMYFVDFLVTSTSGSFPKVSARKQKKLRIIGQAIDSLEFPRAWKERGEFTHAVSVGRLDRSKEIDLILATLRKVSQVDNPIQATFFGSPSNEASREYLDAIRTENENSVTSIKVHFPGDLERDKIKNTLPNYDFFVHAFRGSLDKALLEATLIGIPVVTQNGEYNLQFGSWSGERAPNFECELKAFLETNLETKISLCEKRRKYCLEHHSLDNWITELSGLLSPQ